jgi:hypothetical protein
MTRGCNDCAVGPGHSPQPPVLQSGSTAPWLATVGALRQSRRFSDGLAALLSTMTASATALVAWRY